MPRVTIRTGFSDANGEEESLSDYVCDWPDCPNIASQVLGIARELRSSGAVCDEHAALIKARAEIDRRH